MIYNGEVYVGEYSEKYNHQVDIEGWLAISICKPELAPFNGKKIKYTLMLYDNTAEKDNELSKKSNELKVKYLNSGNHGERYYSVKGKHDEYMVDIKCGCGCPNYGIQGTKTCSHILAALKHIIATQSYSLTQPCANLPHQGDGSRSKTLMATDEEGG